MRLPAKNYRRRLLSMLVFGVFVTGCMTLASAEIIFEKSEVVTGSAKRQTILTGFLLGGPVAELAMVHIDKNDDRRLRFYAFGEGKWARKLKATLRPEVLFVDVANVGGRDRLITYEPGRLNWFDPDSATERELVAVTSNYKAPRKGEIPHVDVTRDVNGDDRDDLVVPSSDGFWVFIQKEGGGLADPVKIGPSVRLCEVDGYRHNPWVHGRVHEMDYNRDGRSDLVFWNEDHFEVHLQDERGRFGKPAETFTTDVAFDSDDLASLVAPREVRRRRKDHLLTGDMTGRVLHSLADLNGDGVADLGFFSLKNGGSNFLGQTSELWNMHSTYEVHFGSPTPVDGTVFAAAVGTAIQSDGIPFGVEQHDFDRDGQVDMMFTTIKSGVFKAISMLSGALLTNSVSLDLKFYRMEGGSYSEKPNTTRTIKAYISNESGEKTAHSSVLIGDVNGDGRSDLLVGRSRKQLRVFLGVPGPDLFAQRPQRVAVTMPTHEEYTWLVDLNKDGKQDILMHHPYNTKPQRVTILIAQ